MYDLMTFRTCACSRCFGRDSASLKQSRSVVLTCNRLWQHSRSENNSARVTMLGQGEPYRMPRPTQLSSIPTEALVDELKRRFAAIERARAVLFDAPVRFNARSATGKKRTSAYSQKVSSLNQSIRHATTRIKNKKALPDDQKNVAKWRKELAKVQNTHKGR